MMGSNGQPDNKKKERRRYSTLRLSFFYCPASRHALLFSYFVPGVFRKKNIDMPMSIIPNIP